MRNGVYVVDRLVAVDTNGETRDVVVIGGDWKGLRRFLGEEEQTLDEFLDAHPRKEEVGTGKDFRPEVFRQLCPEYRRQLG